VPSSLNGAASSGHGSNSRYAEAAFEKEIAVLQSTSNGSRNDQLNRSAFALGQFVGAGALERSTVESTLENTAAALGLVQDDGLSSVRATIRSGIEGGLPQPRQVPSPRDGHMTDDYKGTAIVGNAPVGIPDMAPEAASTHESKSAFELLTLQEMAAIPRAVWLVRSLLIEKTASVISADSGGFKSFFALIMALCVALGRPFMGREVKQGTAVYVAAEGFYTIAERAQAFALHHECELPENFHALKVPVNLGDANIVAAFADAIASLNPALVVLDTLSQCAIGANENDNGQMADFVRGMMALCARIGAHVTVLHHNGKASGTFRGAGAIKANVDAHITLERPEGDEENTVFVRCEKQRGRPFEPFALRGIEVELPFADEYGDAVTSLVFEPCGDEVTVQAPKSNATAKAGKTRAALLEAFDRAAVAGADFGGVKVGFWKEAVEESDPPICGERQFWKYRTALENDGTIEQCGTHRGSPIFRRKNSISLGTAPTALLHFHKSAAVQSTPTQLHRSTALHCTLT